MIIKKIEQLKNVSSESTALEIKFYAYSQLIATALKQNQKGQVSSLLNEMGLIKKNDVFSQDSIIDLIFLFPKFIANDLEPSLLFRLLHLAKSKDASIFPNECSRNLFAALKHELESGRLKSFWISLKGLKPNGTETYAKEFKNFR